MGSSRGEGAAGLLMCRGVPSGARPLLAHPPGKDGALSPQHPAVGLHPPALMASTSSSVVVGFSHTDRLSVRAGEGPEESVDDHTFRHLRC